MKYLIKKHLNTYDFFPIQYENEMFVVKLIFHPISMWIRVSGTIYAYNQKKHLFHGHKGKKIYTVEEIDMCPIDGGKDFLNCSIIDKTTMMKYHPEIIKELFCRYATYKESVQKELEEEKRTKTLVQNWDGIIHL